MAIPLPDKRYLVVSSLKDQAVSFGFDPFLYLLPQHLHLQPCSRLLSFYLIDSTLSRVAAHFPVFLEEDQALSPCLGPFGSVQFIPDLTPLLLRHFLEAVLQALNLEGAQQLRIVSYPGCYAPEQSALLTHTLHVLGFHTEATQTNHHIPITDQPLAERMHQSARRRLAKCRKAGFFFNELGPELLPQAYDFIRNCRLEKKQSISLSLEQVERQVQLFPDRYKLFAVTAGEEWAALTLAVKVNRDILYNFYPASPLRYNPYSPVVMLNEGLYNYCREQQYQLLDLGISARPGEEHPSLMAFKEHIGGQVSNKTTFGFIFPGNPDAAT